MFGDGSPDAKTGAGTLGLVPRVCEELIDAMQQRKSEYEASSPQPHFDVWRLEHSRHLHALSTCPQPTHSRPCPRHLTTASLHPASPSSHPQPPPPPALSSSLLPPYLPLPTRLGIASKLSVAYVEIFGSEVTDLLRGGASIGSSAPTAMSQSGGIDNTFHAHRWVLDGRVDVPIDSLQRAMDVIAQGDRCKRRAATAMNQRSSRAHALFILTLTQSRPDGAEVSEKLFLADLGGSEKLTKSQAADEVKALVSVDEHGDEVGRLVEEYYEARQKLQESLNINVGLFCLQKCIEALLKREQAQAEGKTVHVPFGDSKLTLLLKDALTGGARLTVLTCASLEPRNAVESIQTLRFGESCSMVEMKQANKSAGAGAAALRKLIGEIDNEIAEVQAVIVRDQRWEKRMVVKHSVIELKDNVDFSESHDDIEDYTNGVKVVKADDGTGAKQTVAHEVESMVLVGAEEAEARLEKLLQRKRELLGE